MTLHNFPQFENRNGSIMGCVAGLCKERTGFGLFTSGNSARSDAKAIALENLLGRRGLSSNARSTSAPGFLCLGHLLGLNQLERFSNSVVPMTSEFRSLELRQMA